MLLPEDLGVISNYCTLVSRMELTGDDFSAKVEFETLALQLEQCPDGASRAKVLAENISLVSADLTPAFTDAIGRRMH